MANPHRFSKPESESKESLLSRTIGHSFEYDADVESITQRTPGAYSNHPYVTKEVATSSPKEKGSFFPTATTRTQVNPLSDSIKCPHYPPSYTSGSISRGYREPRYLPRGLRTRPSDETRRLENMEAILNYSFTNPDLLEEALESPSSGIAAVGLRQAVLKLVMRDLCYVLQVPEGDIDKFEERIIGRNNLDRVGKTSKIEQFVRPMMHLPPTNRNNILQLLKDDARREDPVRTLKRAMKAVVGAVYYDGGLESARLIMGNLDLLIKVPG